MVGQPYSGPDCDLRPDAEQITAFVQHWFAFCTGGVLEIGWLDPGGRGLVNFRQFALDSVAELVATAVVENLAPGQSMYIRAATVRERSDGGFTRDADMVQAPGLWGDLDTPEQMERARQVVSMFRPTCRVLTGSVPYERAQLWFRCSEPLVGPENVRQLNQGLWRLYGGDPAVVNPTRLMRLPGTIAWPVKPGRVPELTMLVQYTDGRPLAHPVASLRSFLRLGEEAGPSVSASVPEGMLATLSRWDEVLRLVRAGAPGWHNSMVALVGHWVSRGWTAREILAAAESFRQPGYTLEETLVEVWRAVEGAFRKQFEPEPGVDPSAAEGWDEPESAGSSHGRLLTLRELENMQPPGWAIEGWLPAGGMSVVYGEPKSGKTFIVLSMGLHIAAGLPWLGSMPVRQGAVVYIAGEGTFGLGQRTRAARAQYGISDEVPFFTRTSALNFTEKGSGQALIALVREVVPAGEPVGLVVVDTLARAMPGAEENSARDVGLVIQENDVVRHVLGCALVQIHHAGKDLSRGLRGTSAIRGAADAVILVEKGTDDDGRVTLKNEDQKDASPADDLGIEMLDVPIPGRIGQSSLVPVLAEAGDASERVAERRLKGATLQVFEVLQDTLAGPEAQMMPSLKGLPEGVRGVPISVFRQDFLARRGELARNASAQRQAFHRALRLLRKKPALAASFEEWIWLVKG
jgi:hypothetical protein